MPVDDFHTVCSGFRGAVFPLKPADYHHFTNSRVCGATPKKRPFLL